MSFAQVHHAKYIGSGNHLHLAEGSGAVTTLYAAPTAFNNIMGMAMDADNRSLWFCNGVDTTGGIFNLDLTSLAVTTLLKGDPVTLYHPRDLIMNQDGDLVFTNMYAATTSPTTVRVYGLFKYSLGKLTTLATAPRKVYWYGGLEIDIDNGMYTLMESADVVSGLFLQVDDNGVVNTLVRSGISARYSISQDIRTGDWYIGSFGHYYQVKKGSPRATSITPASTAHYYAMAFDRASAPRSRIVSMYKNHLYYTDLATRVVTSVTLAYDTIIKRELEFYRGRNVATTKTGPGAWTIHLSFPWDAGENYALGLGYSGVRPGVQLPDGRVINLAPDALTFLSVNNLLGNLFNPGPLELDSRGEARAALDVSSLGSLGGLRVWIQCLVVHKNSIGIIADPVGLTLP